MYILDYDSVPHAMGCCFLFDEGFNEIPLLRVM